MFIKSFDLWICKWQCMSWRLYACDSAATNHQIIKRKSVAAVNIRLASLLQSFDTQCFWVNERGLKQSVLLMLLLRRFFFWWLVWIFVLAHISLFFNFFSDAIGDSRIQSNRGWVWLLKPLFCIIYDCDRWARVLVCLCGGNEGTDFGCCRWHTSH